MSVRDSAPARCGGFLRCSCEPAGGYELAMSSMGDLGRQFERIREHPQPAHTETALDDLETRLESFFEWGRGRPGREINDGFRSQFGASGLSDEYLEAI